MKRFVALLLVVVMALGLFSCNGKSAEVKKVETLIDSIGTVTETSKTKIEDASAAYRALSEEDKKKVENYSVLEAAQKEYAKVAPVSLSSGNIKNFLNMSVKYGATSSSNLFGLSYANTEVTFSTYPIASGSFENVVINLTITAPWEWEVASSDSAYSSSNPQQMNLSIRLPSNGNFTETHKITRTFWTTKPGAECTFTINSVSGTFKRS